jgi:hypothetical protein
VCVCRLHSAYWYYGCRYGLYGKRMSPDGFHSFAERETGVITACLNAGSSMRTCARLNAHSAQQVVKGMYAAFAADWMSVYPSEQIWWIRMEDYMEAPTTHIKVP